MLRTVLLLPLSVASFWTAFHAPVDAKPFTIVASPATVGIASSATSTLARERFDAIYSTKAYTRQIEPAALPLHGEAWIYSMHGAQECAVPSDTFAVGTRELAFVTHAHRELESLSRDEVIGLFRGEIRNWRDLGGVDAPIRLIISSDPEDAEALKRAMGADFAPERMHRDLYCGDARGLRIACRDPFAIVLTARAAAERAILEGASLQVLSLEATDADSADSSSGLTRTLCLRIAHADDSRNSALTSYFASSEGRHALLAAGYEPIAKTR